MSQKRIKVKAPEAPEAPEVPAVLVVKLTEAEKTRVGGYLQQRETHMARAAELGKIIEDLVSATAERAGIPVGSKVFLNLDTWEITSRK